MVGKVNAWSAKGKASDISTLVVPSLSSYKSKIKMIKAFVAVDLLLKKIMAAM